MVLSMEYNMYESHSCETRSVGHIATSTRHCLFFLTKQGYCSEDTCSLQSGKNAMREDPLLRRF